MVFAMNPQDNNDNFVPFDLEATRIQAWWDTIQSRNRYFFELMEMKLHYVDNPDLYLLLLEMDDCLDDLDAIDCPASACQLRNSLERAVQDMTLGLIHLGRKNIQEAQIYFNTSKARYKQTLHDYFDLIP